MTAWRDAGLTAANFSGVEAINQDAGALAGYMIMSVPFIAAGMARGAMAISSHSASFLSPSQRAAEEAAQEKTTGNYAYGNTSLMSRQINTLQQDQLTTAPAMNSGPGRFTAQQADGGITHYNADGTRTYDTGPGMSNLGFSLNKSDDFVARQQEALSQGRGVVDQKREGYSQSFSATMSKSSRLFDTAQQSVSSETSEGRALQDSISVMSQKSAEISEHLQRTGGLGRSIWMQL
jgi:conjugal transfer mating pair stabilization protein TraG